MSASVLSIQFVKGYWITMRPYLLFIFTWKTTVYDGGNVLSAKPVKYKLEYEQI